MLYGWDPGPAGLLLVLGGLIVVLAILWLDYWVISTAAHTRGR
jgi:hypothetical protein